MSFSPLALVHPDASLGNNVRIEPFASVGENVIIGDNTWIASHAIIMPGTRIGNACKIYPGAVIGGAPQDLKYEGEETLVQLEDGVTVREYCTVNRGTAATGKTFIGKNVLIMAYSHVAHDCYIERGAVVANAVHMAGHVSIGHHAIVGGMSAIHQFVRVGDFSFIGGGTLVRKDVPPFVKAAREPLAYTGINSVGLKRNGFDLEAINRIKDVYRILFVRHDNIKYAIAEIEASLPESSEKDQILEFVNTSIRGLIRGFKTTVV